MMSKVLSGGAMAALSGTREQMATWIVQKNGWAVDLLVSASGSENTSTQRWSPKHSRYKYPLCLTDATAQPLLLSGTIRSRI